MIINKKERMPLLFIINLARHGQLFGAKARRRLGDKKGRLT